MIQSSQIPDLTLFLPRDTGKPRLLPVETTLQENVFKFLFLVADSYGLENFPVSSMMMNNNNETHVL